MLTKSKYLQQRKITYTFYKKELNRLFIRACLSDLRLFNNIRFYFYYYLMFNDFKLTKKKFFCIKTFKYRGFMSFFNLSRINFRENVSFAKYSGIKYFSW
jgi:ribosomal protein S14